MSNKKELKSLAFVTIAIVLWSTIEVLSKFIQSDVPPLVLSFMRFFLGTLVLALVFSIRYSRRLNVIKEVGRDWIGFIFLGIVGITFTYILFHVGITLTKASSAAIIFSSNPIFVALIAAKRNEKISVYRLVGIILGFIGVFLVSTELKDLNELASSKFLIGNILMLLSAITWSVYTIYGRDYAKKYDSLSATLFGFLPGIIFMLPCVLLFEDFRVIFKISIVSWSILFFLGVVTVGLGYLLYFKGLKDIEASKGITPFYLKPFFASVFAYLLLGEPATFWLIIGIVVVSFSIALSQN